MTFWSANAYQTIRLYIEGRGLVPTKGNLDMKQIVTFGEALLRLKSPGYERFLQSPTLEATFGGAEFNVATSLSNFGLNSTFVTALPQNAIAETVIRELASYGVDVSAIKKQGKRLGTYYLEAGASHRPSRVIYDRAHSSISEAQLGDFDWHQIFDGAKWFHTTGITPAISQSAADLTLEAMRTAKEMGLTVSLDLNFRGKLWKYGKNVNDVMPDLVRYADIVIAGREDCQKCLSVDVDTPPVEDISFLDHFEALSKKVLEVFPNLSSIVITLRQSISSDYHRWSACMRDKKGFFKSDIYEINNIIDRVGAGDGFASGLIYGLNALEDEKDALDFATVAGCLKHSIPGDMNRITVDEITSLKGSTSAGRVQR